METNSNLNQYITIRTYVKRQTLRNCKNEGISGQPIEEVPEPNENSINVQSFSTDNLAVVLNNRELSHGLKNGSIDVLLNNNKNKLLEVRQQQLGEQKRIEDCSGIENDLHVVDNGTADSDVDSDQEQDITYSGESQPTSEGDSKNTYYTSTNNAETSSISDETDLTLQANSDLEDCENFTDDNEHWYVEEPTWKYVWKPYSNDDNTKGDYIWTKVKNENLDKEIYWGKIRNMDNEWIPQTVPVKEKIRWVPRLIAGKEHGKTIWYYMLPYIPKTAEARKRTLEHIPQLIRNKGKSSWLSQLKFTKKGNKTVWYCKLTPAPDEPEDKKSISPITTKINNNNNNNNSPSQAAAAVVLPLPEIPAAKKEKRKYKTSNLQELRKKTGKPSQWFSKLMKDNDNAHEPKCSQVTEVVSIYEPATRNLSEVRHVNNNDGKKHNKLQLLKNISYFSKEIGLNKKKNQTYSKSVWYKVLHQESDDFHDAEK